MRENKQQPFNILSEEFRKLYNTCDTYYPKLRNKAWTLRRNQQKYSLLKNKLWESGVLNPHTPQGMLNEVFFFNGLNFLLCNGLEHRALKLSQLPKNTSLEGSLLYLQEKCFKCERVPEE